MRILSTGIALSVLAMIFGGVCFWCVGNATALTPNTALLSVSSYLFALGPLALVRCQNLGRRGKDYGRGESASNLVPIASGLLLSVASVFYLESIKKGLSVSEATLIYQAGFLVSGLLGHLFFKETLTLRRILGWLCFFGSIALVHRRE